MAKTLADACSSLTRELTVPCDQQLIWCALRQFANDNLLEEKVELPAFMSGMNRRQMVRTIGLDYILH